MPASKQPVKTDRADVDLYFDVGGGDSIDCGQICVRFQFKAMMNGGYVIMGRLIDSHFNIIKRLLIEQEYFKKARSQIFRCQFRLKWRGTEDNQTYLQSAHIIALQATGGSADAAEIEFIGVDPPSWYLNAGDASGAAYKGSVSDVIAQVVSEYAPNVTLEHSETDDSKDNRWWMMGMDPKSFIQSLLDWSCALTKNKTQWIVAMDDTYMQIMAQDEMPSENVAFYTGANMGKRAGDIREWELVADNALSIVNAKLVTQGVSTVSGQWLDMDTEPDKCVVKDSNTDKKYKASTSSKKSFTKPPDGGPPDIGFTAITSVPEVGSAGDIGKKYSDYIDGRPRAMFLNMANMVMRCRFRVIGHGVYYGGIGLGVNTITVQWMDADGVPFFLSGNWIVYGFDHIYLEGEWTTDVYCARLDYDAAAVAVPGAD